MNRTSFSIEPSFCIFWALSVLMFPLRWITAWLLAIVIHELGHYLALRLFHVNVSDIHINSRGVLMRAHQLTCEQQVICSMAGPAAGFMLLILKRDFPALAICGFLQSVFNLIPVYPLDGGSVLYALVALIGGEGIARKIVHIIGNIMRCLIIAFLLLLGIWLGSLPFFLLIALLFISRTIQIKFPCKHHKVIVQ